MKAFEQPGFSITLMPNSDLSSCRYRFGNVSSSGKLVLPGSAGINVCGVIQIPSIGGEPCRVMTSGVSFIVLGGTVAAGDDISTDANGKAVTTTGTNKIVGKCLVGGSAGNIGCVLLK